MSRQFGALSGLAILLILINHAVSTAVSLHGQAGYPPLVGWQHVLLTVLQALGVFAVPTFLFISGSFVAYAAQGEPPRLSRKFLLSSLRHIIYPYVIWSIIFYVAIFFLWGERYSLFGYIKNLLVGFPYHFVPLLVFWYLLSLLVVRVGRTVYGPLLLVVVALLQLALLNILNPGILGVEFPAWMGSLAPPVLRGTLAEWAIYFPLGLVYGLNTRKLMPWSRKLGWLFALLAALLLVLGLLDAFKVVDAPLARHLCPVPFIFLLPGIKRESIPMLRGLERVGRRTYGIYLTHLIVIYLVAEILLEFLPALAALPLLLASALFIVGLFIPLLLMETAARSPIKPFYRFIFG